MGIVLLRELDPSGMSRQFSLRAIALTMRDAYGRFWGNEHIHKVVDVLAESYAWLKAAGLVIESPLEPGNDVISRRGLGMTADQLAEFRAARRAGYEILDRRILECAATLRRFAANDPAHRWIVS